MKIIVTVGCSGSGKSTWAHEQWENNPEGVVIVNRDKTRELLYGYSESNINEYYQRKDIHRLEKQVTLFEDTLIHDGLNLRKTVIVDATHLKEKYLKRFEFFNVPVEFVVFHEDLLTLIKRDSERTRSVGEDVIKKQYNSFKNLKQLSNLSKVETILDNSNNSACYVIDIDGTIAEKGNRNPYDWKKVGEDTPKVNIINTVFDLYIAGNSIIFCSGRDEVCRNETEQWLYKQFPGIDFDLLMRKEGDTRADWIVKEEFWKDISKTHFIVALIDDRNQVVRRARSLGLDVLQVQYGNF